MENKAGSQQPEEAGQFHDDNDDDVPIASRASLRETGRGGPPPNKDQGQENHSKQLHDKDNYSTEQLQMNKKKVVITGSLHDLVDKDHLREQTLNNTEMSPNTVSSDDNLINLSKEQKLHKQLNDPLTVENLPEDHSIHVFESGADRRRSKSEKDKEKLQRDSSSTEQEFGGESGGSFFGINSLLRWFSGSF